MGGRSGGWSTIQTVPFSGPVARVGRENPAAHGGVCLRQVRTRPIGGVQGREVNQNGRHVEVGPAYPVQSFRWSAPVPAKGERS